MLDYYRVSSIGNFPTIATGQYLFSSCLVPPSRFDFICYRRQTDHGQTVYVHRLCGLEGDTIEMRAGDLFINGHAADGGLTLAHAYILSKNEFNRIDAKYISEGTAEPADGDSVVAFVADEVIRRKPNGARRYLLLKEYGEEQIAAVFSADWNADYFGPVVVPKGKYFVLGDNRSNSLDSRYIGFIDEPDYLSTVLFH